MAITLADMARLKEDKYEAGVIETFIRDCDLAGLLDFETINTMAIHTRRTNSAADLGFRKRGERYSEAKGAIDTISDAVYPLGREINIDKTDMRDKHVLYNPLEWNTEIAIKSIAYTFNQYAINGDQATDEDGFEGIKVRIGNLANTQTVYGLDSSNDLEARPGTATEAQAQALLDALDNAIDVIDGSRADICLTDRDFIRAIKSALRRLGLNKEQDQTKPSTVVNDRDTSATVPSGPALVYNDVKFYDVGVRADQTTKIVGTTSVGGEACRDAYFVRTGKPYLVGIQEYDMEVTPPFMLDDGVSWRTVIDWPVGLHHSHPKFASQLLGVRVA